MRAKHRAPWGRLLVGSFGYALGPFLVALATTLWFTEGVRFRALAGWFAISLVACFLAAWHSTQNVRSRRPWAGPAWGLGAALLGLLWMALAVTGFRYYGLQTRFGEVFFPVVLLVQPAFLAAACIGGAIGQRRHRWMLRTALGS